MSETRIRNAAIGLLLLTLLAMILAIIFLTDRFYSHSREPHYEIPWLASQLETEYLRSAYELELFVEGSGNYEEATLRFDILWSRFNLITEGAERIGIRSERWNGLVPQIQSALQTIDELIGDPEKLRTQAGRDALNHLKALWKPLHRHTQDAVREQWTRHDAEHQDAKAIMVALLVLVLILVLVVATRILIIENGRQRLVERERLAKISAETAVADQERLVASISHELRTPLNAIIGFSEIMKTGRFGPIGKRYEEYAADIHSSGKHLLLLVNQVLDLSSAKDRKHNPELTEVALDEILSEAARIVAPSAAKRHQVLETSI